MSQWDYYQYVIKSKYISNEEKTEEARRFHKADSRFKYEAITDFIVWIGIATASAATLYAWASHANFV